MEKEPWYGNINLWLVVCGLSQFLAFGGLSQFLARGNSCRKFFG